MIGDVLAPGNDVLIDDGLVHLKVEEVEAGKARCMVVVGGSVSAHKGVNLPGVPLPIPSLTPKDIADLELALSLGVDFVALSFVRSAADVRDLCRLIEQAGSRAEVIAKIEKAEAVEALDDILAASDAIMVARGDLGVEIGPASVPLLQKRIILRALDAGKPVITATQMLESMIEHAEPTRAEASDVANAVLDGSSALMLSGETAVGAYPVEAVAYMDRIARAVEPSLDYRHEMPDPAEQPGVGRAMSNAACDIAETLAAAAILVPTATGQDGVRGRPAAPAPLDRRPDPQPVRGPADGAGVGGDPAAGQGGAGRRGPLGALDRRGPGRWADRARRQDRDDGGDVGEHPGHDERDQGRRRVAPGRKGGAGRRTRAAMLRFGRRRWMRLFALGVAVLLALLYYRPVRTYLHTRDTLRDRSAEVHALAARKHQLETRLAQIEQGSSLVRGARRLGLVKPGEHLFIVQGISEWRRAHSRK